MVVQTALAGGVRKGSANCCSSRGSRVHARPSDGKVRKSRPLLEPQRRCKEPSWDGACDWREGESSNESPNEQRSQDGASDVARSQRCLDEVRCALGRGSLFRCWTASGRPMTRAASFLSLSRGGGCIHSA